MAQVRQVKDLMVDIFDFPHIPYWFTVRQAIGIIKASAAAGGRNPEPRTLLVFDEKYCLLGTVGLPDLLKGIEPRFQQAAAGLDPGAEASGPTALPGGLFGQASRAAAERPVREVMHPVRCSVTPGAPVTEAAYLMLSNSLDLLPVLEDAKKFVGLVRMAEIFDVLTGAVMEA